MIQYNHGATHDGQLLRATRTPRGDPAPAAGASAAVDPARRAVPPGLRGPSPEASWRAVVAGGVGFAAGRIGSESTGDPARTEVVQPRRRR